MLLILYISVHSKLTAFFFLQLLDTLTLSSFGEQARVHITHGACSLLQSQLSGLKCVVDELLMNEQRAP